MPFFLNLLGRLPTQSRIKCKFGTFFTNCFQNCVTSISIKRLFELRLSNLKISSSANEIRSLKS